MRTLLLLTCIATILPTSSFARVRRMYTDTKLPTQQLVEKQSFENVAAADTTLLASAIDGPTSASAVTVTSFDAQPDVPRNLVITPGGSTGDLAACTIVVTGTNIQNDVITENFAFLADASSAVTGSKAFNTVTSVLFPANCEEDTFGTTWDIGTGDKLGVKYCMDAAGHILFSTLNGSKEGTAPTMAVNASAVESNTAVFDGSLNGTNDFELFFFQNFACL